MQRLFVGFESRETIPLIYYLNNSMNQAGSGSTQNPMDPAVSVSNPAQYFEAIMCLIDMNFSYFACLQLIP